MQIKNLLYFVMKNGRLVAFWFSAAICVIEVGTQYGSGSEHQHLRGVGRDDSEWG